jgi:hypothetical protein
MMMTMMMMMMMMMMTQVCDVRCNNADCAWDAGDCGIGLVYARHDDDDDDDDDDMMMTMMMMMMMMTQVCDVRCNNADCAWDAGDCGIGLVYARVPGAELDRSRHFNLTGDLATKPPLVLQVMMMMMMMMMMLVVVVVVVDHQVR